MIEWELHGFEKQLIINFFNCWYFGVFSTKNKRNKFPGCPRLHCNKLPGCLRIHWRCRIELEASITTQFAGIQHAHWVSLRMITNRLCLKREWPSSCPNPRTSYPSTFCSIDLGLGLKISGKARLGQDARLIKGDQIAAPDQQISPFDLSIWHQRLSLLSDLTTSDKFI